MALAAVTPDVCSTRFHNSRPAENLTRWFRCRLSQTARDAYSAARPDTCICRKVAAAAGPPVHTGGSVNFRLSAHKGRATALARR